MEKYPGIKSTDRGVIHTSLQYLCCYGLGEYNKYIAVVNSFPWASVNVTYSRAVCNSDGGDEDHNSLIVLMDGPSQVRMQSLIKDFETALIAAGFHINRTRALQEPFHTTLGVVGKNYPVDAVLTEINNAIPVWSDVPINLKNFLLMPVPTWQFHSNDSFVGAVQPDDRTPIQWLESEHEWSYQRDTDAIERLAKRSMQSRHDHYGLGLGRFSPLH